MISKSEIRFVRQLEQKKHRLEHGLFVAEGPKVVGDLIAAGFVSRRIYATEGWLNTLPQGLDNIPRATKELPVTAVTADELQRLSFLQHPQKVVGLFEQPEEEELEVDEGGLYLVLDNVQDPGNMGTIIRLADWFGITAVVCSPDSADVFSPKVVQATMGSLAHVRVKQMPLEPLLRSTTLPVYGTLLDGNDIYAQPLTSNGIIVMGNEGRGISPAIRQLITKRLLIPTFREGQTADSLNVAIATAITCSEFRRRSRPL